MSLQSLIGQFTITVQRQVSSKDAAGGITNTWTDLYTGVRARIEDASANTIEKFARLQMEVSHEIFTQQSGITNGMRVLDSEGGIYTVTGVTREQKTGGIDTYYEVYAMEVKARS